MDLRAICSPIEDQGNIGSCTAQAGVGVYEFVGDKMKAPYEDKSRLALYWMTRSLEGTVPFDSGATLRNTVKAMAKFGLGNESKWPYVTDKFFEKPPQSFFQDASDHKITAYQRLNTLDDVLGCLADGFAFMFGFSVYSSMMTDKVGKTGQIPMPKKTDSLEGGHAIVGVGYTEKERLIIRNSWGRKWGDDGYGYLPFGYIKDRNLSDDFWTVRKQN